MKNIIKNHCKLIGSRKWGGFTENSDWDFLVDEIYINTIISKAYLQDYNVDIIADYCEEAHTMHNISNVKCSKGNTVLNFISYYSEDLPHVIKLADLMQGDSLLHNKISESKEVRTNVFMALLDSYFEPESKTQNIRVPEIDIDDDDIPF